MIPKVLFSVESGMYSEFLNYLIDEGFSIFDIKSEELGFSAICYAKDYKKISRISHKFQCRVRLKNKIGIYFKIDTSRKGIVVGSIIFTFLLIAFTRIIWIVNINTNDLTLKNNIAAILYSQNICAGTYFKKEKLEKAKEVIMIENNDIGEVTLNFYRGVLNCEIYPRLKKEEYTINEKEGDIQAQLSGIVTDLRVYSGFSNVELGQSVSQGDIIVSCLHTDEFNNVYYQKTNAYIEALCDKKYTVYIPYNKECNLYTGKESKEICLNRLGKNYNLNKAKNDKWTNSTFVKKVRGFSFLGFHFPFTVEETTYYQIEKFKVENNDESAKNIGKLQIQHMISNDIKLKREKNREYNFIPKDDGILVECTVTGYYEIT